MTTRERFNKVMAGDPSVDQSPVIDWCAWWDKTLREWEEQGMPRGLSWSGIFEYLGMDELISLDFVAIKSGCPSHKTNNAVPIIIRDEEDYDRLKEYFYPDEAVSGIGKQMLEVLPKIERGLTPALAHTVGYFWFPRSLFGDEAHLYSFYDYPELYHRICEDLLQWHLRIVRELRRYVKLEYICISEDMSYNHGSLISKEHYDEFLMPYYRRLFAELKKDGTRIILDSDGDVTDMIPWFLEAGFDGVAPLERRAGVDLVELRRRYPDFLFIGAFDKMALLDGKEAIEREFERLLPVIESGKYIVSVDHQAPPGVTLENYKYYLELYRKYAVRSCKARL